MVVQDWIDVIVASLQDLWVTVVGFLPALVGALVIFVVGLIVAAVLERVVERVVYFLKLDVLLRRLGVEGYLQRANLDLDSGHFFGRLVYWFITIAFLLAASDTLQFYALSDFLKDVLNYIPHVVVAALILLAALVVANFVYNAIRASVMGAKLHMGKGVAMVAWWGVVVFGMLTALSQLGIAVTIINALITGFIAMLAIAGGLAFGLGGKEVAGRWLKEMEDEMMHKG